MGFNRTAVKTAVEGIGSGGEEAVEPRVQPEVQPPVEARESFEQFPPRLSAVLCGTYRSGIPSLLRAYETLSAAGMSVLAPSGLEFVAEIHDAALHQDEVGIPPEAMRRLRLDCISTADLVWLHAPDGYVSLSSAVEIGFANAAGVPVYAEEVPNDVALRSLVIIAPLARAIVETSIGQKGHPGASPLPPREHDPAPVRARGSARPSAEDLVRMISEEIGELARQNPGQRQRPPGTS
jgi:hypothetical protein